MISLTAAMHSSRRTSRPMGTHLKAFGSGRVMLGSIDEESETLEKRCYFTHKQIDQQNNRFIISIKKAFSKLVHVFLQFINSLCPLVSLMIDLKEWSEPRILSIKKAKRIAQNSVIDRLEDKTLLRIFKFCDAQSVINLESACSRFRQIIHKNCNDLAKVQKDQLKLHFDEGEVIIFSLDQRKSPARFPMISIEHLGNHLKHINTLSLFIRGLIPIESVHVLKRLARYDLCASQIYFLWCEFDQYSAEHLKNLFIANVRTLSDIGFEICSPTSMISDDLIDQNLSQLVSLRVWHENPSSNNIYAISDQTLFKLADLFLSGAGCPLETLDIAGGSFTVSSLCYLIEAWYSQTKPKNDIYISLHNCNFTQADITQQCYGIPLNFKRGGLQNRGYRLTLNIN